MSSARANKIDDSGAICLKDDVVAYTSTTLGDWQLPVSSVLLIGEYTDQDGPCLDDYFYCFVSTTGLYREASFYAEGRNDFFRELQLRLGGKMDSRLYSSTDFRSRIIWPDRLIGLPFLKYKQMPRGFWGKLFDVGPVMQEFSDTVLEELRRVGVNPETSNPPE